jgi:hypothetical protein
MAAHRTEKDDSFAEKTRIDVVATFPTALYSAINHVPDQLIPLPCYRNPVTSITLTVCSITIGTNASLITGLPAASSKAFPNDSGRVLSRREVVLRVRVAAERVRGTRCRRNRWRRREGARSAMVEKVIYVETVGLVMVCSDGRTTPLAYDNE